MNNVELFSQIVSYLEKVLEHPYLKEFEVSNYSELACALNHYGVRNSRGQKLTKKIKSVSRSEEQGGFLS